MNELYFDYAAATPVDPLVLQAMMPFFTDQFQNPSALYTSALGVKKELENARSMVAQAIGARPSEIIFTAGGSESTNLAIKGIMSQYPDGNVVVSAVEHDAVLKPASQFNCRIAPVDAHGVVNITALEELIDDTTVLVSVMYANNEVGSLQPLTSIAAMIKQKRQDRLKRGIATPLYLHTDACQAPLYLDVQVSKLGVDLMTLNGGKMYGPKQSGILYVRAGMVLSPLVLGGGQEFGMRQGTENVAFAVGFAVALQAAVQGRHERVHAVSLLRDKLIDALETEFSAEINGHRQYRIANNIHVTFQGTDNERVLFALDEMGIAAASGSACSASSDEPSHVLKAMGCTDEAARASLRFTIGRDTTEESIDRLIESLKIALKR